MEIQLVRGKAVNEVDDFEELGEIAHSLDICMAIHAPYYMDFLGNGYMRNKSSKFLQFAGEIGARIGARTIVTHIGRPTRDPHARTSLAWSCASRRCHAHHAVPRRALSCGRAPASGRYASTYVSPRVILLNSALMASPR